jgi:uncharacterized protein (TIGR02246 family)
MSEESDQQEIRNVIEAWMRALAENDLNALLSLIAEDAVFLSAGSPRVIRGRDAFAAYCRAKTGAFKIRGNQVIQEIHVIGDYGFCRCSQSITVTQRVGGEPIPREGDIMSIFRREPDGRWVLFRDANMVMTTWSFGGRK